jgi:hypothetical protein
MAIENELQIVDEANVSAPVEVDAENILYPDKEVESQKPAETPIVVEEKEVIEPEKSVSDELTLVVPDGSNLSDADIVEMKEFAKVNKLSQESAQKILDEKAGFASKILAKQNADFKEKTTGWLNEVKQIKTFDEDLKANQQVLDGFFDADFKKMLNESGLGNHPSLFKGFAKLGKAMNPQKFVTAPKNAVAKKLSDEELFYGPNEVSV